MCVVRVDGRSNLACTDTAPVPSQQLCLHTCRSNGNVALQMLYVKWVQRAEAAVNSSFVCTTAGETEAWCEDEAQRTEAGVVSTLVAPQPQE